jgi:DDE superfamily endonuclease
VLAAPPRADSGAPRHLGHRRHRSPEAGDRVGGGAATVLRGARQDRQLPGRCLDRLDRPRAGVADVDGVVSPTHDDRRARARIPRPLAFREKWRIAVTHVRTVLAAGFTLEAVVADAAYGEIAQFRAALERLGVAYVVAVPYFVGARLTATASRESLAALGNSLAPSAWHRIRWGQGTKGPLEARFAAVRVQIPKSRSDRWLLCQESLVDGERQYYFSNLPPTTPLKTLVRIARSRGAIEVQYRDLKSEVGLDHFEGRSYPGGNHHAVLAAMTFNFLQLERRRRCGPLPTFPEMRDLMREVMAALLWTARPGWLKLTISFQRNPPLRI